MTLSDFLKKKEYTYATQIEIIPEGCKCGLFLGDIEKIPKQILSREVVGTFPYDYGSLVTAFIKNEEEADENGNSAPNKGGHTMIYSMYVFSTDDYTWHDYLFYKDPAQLAMDANQLGLAGRKIKVTVKTLE